MRVIVTNACHMNSQKKKKGPNWMKAASNYPRVLLTWPHGCLSWEMPSTDACSELLSCHFSVVKHRQASSNLFFQPNGGELREWPTGLLARKQISEHSFHLKFLYQRPMSPDEFPSGSFVCSTIAQT